MPKRLSSLTTVVIVLSTLLASCGRAERPTPATPTEDTRARPVDGMTMVYVPGGEFRMGQTWSLQDRVHTVELDSFWIDQTEVTNAHYRHCVEAGACRAPTTCNWGEPTYEDTLKTDHPVICVTWQAASDYCRWAGGRLPTEAEWEYAARGPRATTYPWGDDLDGTLLNSCDVNCPHEDQRATDLDDGHALTAPVGSYPGGASWCGALDMVGNVWEWVADWHGPYPFTRQTNPTGPESGSEKLIRGGSWYENNEYGALRADNRHPFEPRDYNHLIGFRCLIPEKAAFSYWPTAAPDEQGMDDGLLAEIVDTIPPTATAAPPSPTRTPLPLPTATPVPPTAVPPAAPTPAPLLSFENSPQLFGRSETFQAGLGDLDGDGDLDAVFANMAANNSGVWFNDGLGTFHDSGQKLTQQGHGLGLGDLDGDGDLDILMTCAHFRSGGGWRKVPSQVYLNDGQGVFHDSGQDLGDTELSGNGVNLIDLDGDGDLDAHVVYYEVAGMPDRVYLNDGGVQGGTIGRFSDSGLALEEEEIAWGDLDGDGDVDMLAKAYGQGYRVYLNDGAGQFVPGWQMEDSQAMYGDLALADLDGDGDLDALIASGFRSEGSFPTRLLWNDGGRFTDSGQQLNKTMGARFAVGDLDGDGSLDVFVANMDRLPSEAWLNDGAGRLVDSGLRLESPSGHLATWPSLGDLDGDGDLDLIEAGFGGQAEVWLNRAPSPSAPQGTGLIAFYSDRDGNPEIYVMNPDGSAPRRLTFNAFEDSSPDWSPDGRQIAFISDRDDPQAGHCFPDCAYQIYLIHTDGSGEHKLLDTEFRCLHPDWHPDGSRLSFDTEFNLEGDIYVVNADGSGLRRLIEDGFWADWSPDGTQIVFASRRDGNVELYLADADGSNQRRLTDNRDLDYFPAWSPDGRRIAFARLETKQIHVMDMDGSDEQQLTRQQHAENPSWLPDGTEVVFQSDSEGTFEIYAIQVEDALQGKEGSGPRRLTENSAADMWPSWISTPGGDLYLGQTPPGLDVEIFAPGIVSIEEGKEYKITISPDLQEILFTRRTPGGRDDRLWVSRLENGKLTIPELAPFTYDAFETDACFTPDGNRLYFKSARPLPSAEAPSRLPNVWFVDRTATGWSEPHFAGSPLNDYQPVYFSFANDGTLYFTRSSPRGIYYAEPEAGEYREAHRLPDEVNHVREVAHPAIAPDESYLVVDSAYEQGGRLRGSLYVSFRSPDGAWTQAVSLHDALNATEADVYGAPRISPDGKYLFFEKYDRETDRSDLYWASTDVIKKLVGW